MVYSISKTNGTPLTTLQDYTVNTTSTSISLMGRGVPNYGTIVASEMVHMLENFAAMASPANPLVGQLWMDLSTNLLRFYSPSNTWDALATQNWVESWIEGYLGGQNGVVPGTYTKVTVNSIGIVTSGSQLAAIDITTALGYVPVNSGPADSTVGPFTITNAHGDTAITEGNATLVLNSTSNAAVLAFNVVGTYGSKIGMSADGTFHFGGWSSPANTMTLDASGNLTTLGSISNGNGDLWAPTARSIYFPCATTVFSNMSISYSALSYPDDPYPASVGHQGLYSWTIPTGVYRIRVKMVGAGGGGSNCPFAIGNIGNGPFYAGAGGGAGQYREQVYAVTPGQIVSVYIGAAGKGGDSDTYDSGHPYSQTASPFSVIVQQTNPPMFFNGTNGKASRFYLNSGSNFNLIAYGGGGGAWNYGPVSSGGQGTTFTLDASTAPNNSYTIQNGVEAVTGNYYSDSPNIASYDVGGLFGNGTAISIDGGAGGDGTLDYSNQLLVPGYGGASYFGGQRRAGISGSNIDYSSQRYSWGSGGQAVYLAGLNGMNFNAAAAHGGEGYCIIDF
jgi:hypothetical protein